MTKIDEVCDDLIHILELSSALPGHSLSDRRTRELTSILYQLRSLVKPSSDGHGNIRDVYLGISSPIVGQPTNSELNR